MLRKITILTVTVCVALAARVTAQTTISLKQAILTAKENNPVLKTERYSIDIAQSDIVTARLRPNPILNNQFLQLSAPMYFPPGTDYLNGKNRQVWWQLTKPFQLPALRKYKIETAEQNAKLSQKNYAETERGLFFAVAGNWLDAWNAKRNLDLIVKAQANIDSVVYINELRLKNQVITETDLIRTQLLADQYKLQLKTAQQEYRSQLQSMKFLLGRTDSIEVDVNDQFISPSSFDKADSLLNFAASSRSDVQAAQGAIDVSSSNIKLQKAMSRPTPELGMIYNPQNTIPYWGFYGTLQIPIFSRNQGEIQKSKVLQQQAQQNYQAIQLQVKTEINSAYNSFQINKQNVEKYKTIMQKAEQVLSSVKYSYLRGGTTIIDLLEAQRTWFDTQKMYYEAQYSFRKSYIQLLYSAGLINQL